MTTTMTTHHEWIKMTMTRIDLVPDPDNDEKVVVLENPGDVATVEDRAVYGCDVCGVVMEGNTDTLCEGPTDE